MLPTIFSQSQRRSSVYTGYAILLYVLLFGVSGCSRLNCTPLEDLLGADVDLVDLGDDIAADLIYNSYPPLLPSLLDQPVLITTVVNNENLAESSPFGRNLQNHIVGGFTRRGLTVREFKLTGSLRVLEGEGEFMLSRRLSEIGTTQRAQAIVTGTYTVAGRVMYLSFRLISPENRVIRSAKEMRICLDENSLILLGLQFEEASEMEPPSRSLLDKIF